MEELAEIFDSFFTILAIDSSACENDSFAQILILTKPLDTDTPEDLCAKEKQIKCFQGHREMICLDYYF
jgi:hypothetical protein